MRTFGPAETIASFILCEQVVEKSLAVAVEAERRTRACSEVAEKNSRYMQFVM